MHKLLNIFLVIILLSACSNNDSANETKLSSLIKADFSYTQDLFDCTLNENESLISLESFFSKNYTYAFLFVRIKSDEIISYNFPRPVV